MSDNVIDVPWNLTLPQVDVHLVGYGMRLPNDLTIEALAVLKNCKKVFGVPALNAPELGIPPMENLGLLYAPDKNRNETYREWLELVLDAAAADPPVAFATYGSAMAGALVSHRILEEAPRRGLTVHVTNAVSCIDGIWADLNIEPFLGFEIWEATAFVQLAVEPTTRAHLMLPQAPVFEVKTGPNVATQTIATSSTLVRLRDHLLRFYPAEHTVHYVYTGSGTGPAAIGPSVESLPLGDLDHPGRLPLSTLVVPRLARSKQLDFEMPAALAGVR